MMLRCPKMVYSMSVVPNLPFDLVFKIEDLSTPSSPSLTYFLHITIRKNMYFTFLFVKTFSRSRSLTVQVHSRTESIS